MYRPCPAILAACLLWSCGKTPDTQLAKAPETVDADRRDAAVVMPAVIFETAAGPVRVDVEIAREPREVQRGLMHRQHLDADAGMLFLFPYEKVQSFWMKNTLIPLDMIFVAKDMTVVGVVENAEPLTTTGRTVGKPSQYVVEVNGGWARDHGVAAGTRVTFENVPK